MRKGFKNIYVFPYTLQSELLLSTQELMGEGRYSCYVLIKTLCAKLQV